MYKNQICDKPLRSMCKLIFVKETNQYYLKLTILVLSTQRVPYFIGSMFIRISLFNLYFT